MKAKNRKEKNKESFIQNNGVVIVLSIAISFFVSLYAPLEIYFTNQKEVWFDFPSMIAIDVPFFLILSFVIFLVLFFTKKINQKIYQVLYCLGSILYFSSFIEGNFFASKLPRQDGRNINWNEYPELRIISITIYIAITLIVIALWRFMNYKKAEAIISYALSGLTLILMITVITVGIQQDGFAKKNVLAVKKDYEFEMSNDKNLVVLIIDGVDADLFENVLDNHPEYYSYFSDFSYYKNMSSCYTQTEYSIPLMLTGEWDDKNENYDAYSKRAYDSSPFFDYLEREKYRISLYEENFVPSKSKRVYDFVNIKSLDTGRKPEIVSFIKNQTEMVGFRYAPFDFKRFCIIDNIKAEFKSYGYNSELDENNYREDNYDFYSDLKCAQITTVNDKCMKWYHIEGGHVPFEYDENVNRDVNGTYETTFAATMTISYKLIEKMKEAGVYDNSAIIIMADHGYSLEDIPEDRLHPVFFVKGIGEKSDKMRISEAPVSHEDLLEAYNRLIDGNKSDEIFEWKDGDTRDRRCFVYSYPVLWKNIEYIQHGYAGDLDTLERVY